MHTSIYNMVLFWMSSRLSWIILFWFIPTHHLGQIQSTPCLLDALQINVWIVPSWSLCQSSHYRGSRTQRLWNTLCQCNASLFQSLKHTLPIQWSQKHVLKVFEGSEAHCSNFMPFGSTSLCQFDALWIDFSMLPPDPTISPLTPPIVLPFFGLSGGCTALLTAWGSGSEGFRCWLQLLHCTYLLSMSEWFVQGWELKSEV